MTHKVTIWTIYNKQQTVEPQLAKLKLTWAKQSPMVPVPQQMSNSVVSLLTPPNSMAVEYRASAACVLTWKKASGEMRKVSPRMRSVMCVAPSR